MVISFILMCALGVGIVAIAASEIVTSPKGIDEEELRHIEAK